MWVVIHDQLSLIFGIRAEISAEFSPADRMPLFICCGLLCELYSSSSVLPQLFASTFPFNLKLFFIVLLTFKFFLAKRAVCAIVQQSFMSVMNYSNEARFTLKIRSFAPGNKLNKTWY